MSDSTLSLDGTVIRDHHSHSESGRFVVPLPKKSDARPIGESRSQAVRCFLSQERSLRPKNQFKFETVMKKYVDLEPLPSSDLDLEEASASSILSPDACRPQRLEYHYIKYSISRCMPSTKTRVPLPKLELCLMRPQNHRLECRHLASWSYPRSLTFCSDSDYTA